MNVQQLQIDPENAKLSTLCLDPKNRSILVFQEIPSFEEVLRLNTLIRRAKIHIFQNKYILWHYWKHDSQIGNYHTTALISTTDWIRKDVN